MLLTYGSVIEGETAVYCSAPITSGRRYLDWLDHIGKDFANIDAAGAAYHASHREHVIEPNTQHAQAVVRRLRQELGRIVIDPTALPHLEGWSQHDWRAFWQRVIERFAGAAYFVEGWPFSSGAVFEFWVACHKGIPTFDERGAPLNLEKGVVLVEAACAEMRQRGAEPTFLEGLLDDLKALPAPAGVVSSR